MILKPAKCNLAVTDNGKSLFNAVLSDIIHVIVDLGAMGRENCQHTNIFQSDHESKEILLTLIYMFKTLPKVQGTHLSDLDQASKFKL